MCAEELGCEVAQLLTPLTRFSLQKPDGKFAIDNGAYSRFDVKAFESLLAREYDRREQCLFVCAPDVVGSARRTLEIFGHWKESLTGWPIALVMQDGQQDLPIPWDEIDAVFIGGTTAFKDSPAAEQIVRAAKILGKWAHVGRVNNPARFDHFEKMGADSVDGSGIARYSHMRDAISKRDRQLRLA